MNIQIGIGCEDQALCDQVGIILGFSFLGLLVWFVIYLVVSAIKNKK